MKFLRCMILIFNTRSPLALDSCQAYWVSSKYPQTHHCVRKEGHRMGRHWAYDGTASSDDTVVWGSC
jgi:hypothetical protein